MSYIVLRCNRGRWYKYEVESFREDGQVKKRQTYLGRATSEEIEAWCRKHNLDPTLWDTTGIKTPKEPETGLRNDPGAFQAQKKPPPEQEREALADQAPEAFGEGFPVEETRPNGRKRQSLKLRLYVMNTQTVIASENGLRVKKRKPHLDFLREWALPRFEEKFGQPADTVFANPKDFPALHPNDLGVRILKCQYIQPNCFQLARRG